MKVIINIQWKDKKYSTTFMAPEGIQEYKIADEAFRLADLFVQTQYIAEYGVSPSQRVLSQLYQDLDYDYTIERED